ncbi:Serine acetyltransferase 5 [Glycine soja]|uniref:Serine acetyltransferase 5 n=1 Tax=Glycine soja TaxID=3848 RepID=A0A0B2R0M0_GLYSO|nr:Serine acetyltransferase 5 [Glycine soja]
MPTGLPKANSSVAPDDQGWLWTQIKAEARRDAELEPALASYLYSTILSHSSLERSLSFHLGNKLCSSTLLSTLLYDLFLNAFSFDPSLCSAAVADLRAARERDPACVSYSHCLLNYKGFLACQAHRVAHLLWRQSRRPLALLIDVPPQTTAVGNPARLVGGKEKPSKHEDVPGESMDHTSFISEWSDYII